MHSIACKMNGHKGRNGGFTGIKFGLSKSLKLASVNPQHHDTHLMDNLPAEVCGPFHSRLLFSGDLAARLQKAVLK